MANPEHLEIFKQGVDVWNRWREENPSTRADLYAADLGRMELSGVQLRRAKLNQACLIRANLRGAKLNKANLTEANLSEANLRRADLSGAKLIGSTLNGANLTMANLNSADLSRANLENVDLNRSNLTRANLSEANLAKVYLGNVDLSGANLFRTIFKEAIMRSTRLGDVDLSNTEGLEMVHHEGPSTIGIDTIYRSRGKISENFLRGVGVDDTFIGYITAFTNQPIQYYSCFISYSSQDEAFAQRLHADLQQKGVRCWFAPEDMKIGDKIRPTIDQSIRVHDKLLLVLSENSIASQWVEQEVETALERERKQNEKVLFPVRLDESVMEIESGWPALIRNTRHIGDFSRWRDYDAYQQAFERLLRDLRAEG